MGIDAVRWGIWISGRATVGERPRPSGRRGVGAGVLCSDIDATKAWMQGKSGQLLATGGERQFAASLSPTRHSTERVCSTARSFTTAHKRTTRTGDTVRGRDHPDRHRSFFPPGADGDNSWLFFANWQLARAGTAEGNRGTGASKAALVTRTRLRTHLTSEQSSGL